MQYPLVHFRRLSLMLSLTLAATAPKAQTADDLNQEGTLLVRNLKEDSALTVYQSVLVIQPDNLTALVACSDLSGRIGARMTDKQKARQLELYEAAQDYAAKALKVDTGSSDANCAMALALTDLSQVEREKKRAGDLRDVRTYCDIAIRQNPRNFRAWYVLGKWYYTVVHLGGMEKAGLKVLYGGLPDATIKDAIVCFEKSRSLNRGFIRAYLDLAKAYKDDDQGEKSIAVLQALVRLPVVTEDDPALKAEGRQLLDAAM